MQQSKLGVFPSGDSAKFDISVVTSCYNSENFVDDFFLRHKKCLENLNLSYEFIFVVDGSPDNSREKVLTLAKKYPGIKMVEFSRNFGQHAGMFAGLSMANGKWVYASDCDLEEAPENIEPMYQLLVESSDVAVVYGKLKKRPRGFLSNLVGSLFYTILNFLSEVSIPRNQAWQRIMSRDYVNALVQHCETESLPAGLMILAGYKQVPFEVEKNYKGSSTYTTRKKIQLALNSIVSFSSRPLVLIGLLGFLITGFSFFGVLFMIYYYIFVEAFNPGWASVIASIYLMGGLQLTALGIIGIYLAKVFNQVKRRPMFVVKEIIES